ncbi:MAG: Gfo/Idh/MocA family protein [Candidatus Sumerlaeota bacterium]
MTEKLKMVLIGCGGITGAWLPVIRESKDVDLVAMVDLNRETACERAKEYGYDEALVETDLEKALDTTRPDFILDCTIPEAHYKVTMTALEKDCHVLGEKPLADSMQHAREMVKKAGEAGKIYAVTQNRRFLGDIRRVKQFLDSGALGEITTINCDFYLGPHFGGFREEMDHVLLLDMAIHTFDQARVLTDAKAESVMCHEWNPRGSWYKHGASAVAVFEMSDDLVYTYRGSWCSEGKNTSWEGSWRIIGTQGSLLWDGNDGMEASVVKQSNESLKLEEIPMEIPEIDESAYRNPREIMLEDFIRAIRTDTPPENACTDNIHSLAMVFGAIESAEKNGARVQIEA